MLLLLCTYVYLDELFVTKGLPRDTVMNTGAEKMLSRIFDFLVWAVFLVHALYLDYKLYLKKFIVRYISFSFNKGPLP